MPAILAVTEELEVVSSFIHKYGSGRWPNRATTYYLIA
jgi:hypothetical protein